MKGSLIIVGFFVIGILCGYTGLADIGRFGFDVSFVALAMLIFLVGIGIGHNISGLKKSADTKPGQALFAVCYNYRDIGRGSGCFFFHSVAEHFRSSRCRFWLRVLFAIKHSDNRHQGR